MTGVFDAMTGERIPVAELVQTTAEPTGPCLTVTYWEDERHGWLEVTARQLEQVGLKPADLTEFSYLKRLSKPHGPAGLICYYLEEDADLPKFLVAHIKKFRTMPRILEKYHPVSPIRNYNRIRQNTF